MTRGPAKVEVIDTGCDWSKPIYLTYHDIDVMDKQTKREVLSHNKIVEMVCKNQKIYQAHFD